MTTNDRAVSPGKVMVTALAVLAVVGIVSARNNNDDDDRSASQTTTPTTTTTRPNPYRTIPGDGTHNMGGADGYDWGTYTATIPPSSPGCTWAVVSIADYRGGETLREGEAPSGTVRANIQPDGVASWTGTINGDHRIVFRTSGCGTWTMTD
ncbi:hypothetical protein PBI_BUZZLYSEYEAR_49 [Mycobacterium phage BuzzLyseyear]|uniref:Uncharacterized protein n=2 Tax=Cheoctovirus TaxID=1623281 RepID=G1JTI8_9CAUD|nr:hypothetical protein CL77_gp042 [Mycobacterium phage GUmbie]YP_009125042.1 hypothetical protein PBI_BUZZLYSEYEAR_49 [Mycobacterium phage BuzzLyseyear]AEL20095.1 hypothetical protein GUMBIE_42 [Mycobacterium phage GUmbie]AIM50171.1 hypothetical protein PBI_BUZZLYSEYEAR_49 [Mycobacterium phage BuzzLyseyear]